MEARGVEPLSEDLLAKASSIIVGYWDSQRAELADGGRCW